VICLNQKNDPLKQFLTRFGEIGCTLRSDQVAVIADFVSTSSLPLSLSFPLSLLHSFREGFFNPTALDFTALNPAGGSQFTLEVDVLNFYLYYDCFKRK